MAVTILTDTPGAEATAGNTTAPVITTADTPPGRHGGHNHDTDNTRRQVTTNQGQHSPSLFGLTVVS